MRTKGSAVAGHGSRRAIMVGDLGGMRATPRKEPTELSEDTVQGAVDGIEAFAASVTASMEQNRCERGDVSPVPSPISVDPGQVGWAGIKRF